MINIRQPRLILSALLILVTCGCNAVISKRPVGASPAMIAAKDWEGNWVTSDGVVRIKVLDADKGLLRIFWLEEDNASGSPVSKTADVELREAGGWLLANTKDDKGRGYVWGRIQNEDRQIIVWCPDDQFFARAVNDRILPGKVEGNEVFLDNLNPEHLKLITSTEHGVLFCWDKPSVFMKLSN